MNLDFTFEPKITKSYLLSQYSEETYMEYYLGIKVTKGLFCSPLRRDNTPTCSFYKNKSGELIFKDFNGSFYGNFISVVMEKYHVSYYKALQIIAEDFNLSKRHTDKVVVNPIKPSTTVFKDTGPADVRVEIKDFTQEELNWWNSYGITLDILKKFNVYSCKNIFLNGELFKTIYKDNFMFGYYGGKKDNLELWRIYFPKQSNYRFLTNWPAKKIQGLKQLKKDGDICVITKSMKDTMCLYSLGISAIAPNSENLFIADTILERLKSKFKYIIVLYDSDLPGIQNMRKIKKKHPELIYFYIPRHYNAKDISDFYKKYGKDKTLEFVKDNLNKLK
jgi:toprim domain protein|nr:MAG TPA: DNA primase [Crassvirales sp.]